MHGTAAVGIFLPDCGVRQHPRGGAAAEYVAAAAELSAKTIGAGAAYRAAYAHKQRRCIDRGGANAVPTCLQFVGVCPTSREVSEAGKKRVLRLGITSTTVPTILPDIARFVHAHPDVNFEVRDGTTFTLLQLLLDGIIDVSVARTPLRLENVEYMQLSTEPMIAAFPPDSRVEKEGVLGLRHLLGRPLILYRRYERLILEEFSRQNIHPDVFCVCDDARDAMLWVKAGLATAIFPQSMHSLCTGLRIQPLEETALETQTVLIWKKGGPLSPVVQDFLQVCQAHH